jgi:hypothetical protein
VPDWGCSGSARRDFRLPWPSLAGLLTFLSTVAPAAAADWEWAITPYVWGSDTSLDVTVNDEEVIGGDLSFSGLVDKLDLALQLHVEARREKVGFFFDGTYLDINDGQTRPDDPPLPGGTRVDTEATIGIYELGGFYRPSGESSGLDLLLGVRFIDFEQDIDIALPPPATLATRVSTSESFTDVLAGLRYLGAINQSWSWVLRGDVATGDTDFTWNAVALIVWHVGTTGRYHLLGGFRHMDLELDSGSGNDVQTEITMSGPIVGFTFRF